MAYQTYSITALTDIPANVAAWAATNGWTVDNTIPTQPVFTHPSLVGAVPMRLRAASASPNFDLIFERATSPGAGPLAMIRSPKLNQGTLIPLVSVPTTLHVFSAQTPQPYIAIVVEYGFNSYRHLYFGYLEQLGTFTGGEVLAASNHQDVSNFIFKDFYYDVQHQYLFRGRNDRWAALTSGGVHVNHVNNSTAWRRFFTSATINSLDDFTENEAYGGYMDGPNDGYLQHGVSPFISANILIPANLYMIENAGASAHFCPIGRPAGVRYVNIEDLEPGAQIDVGGANWRVFAAHRKLDATQAPWGLVGDFAAQECSRFVGYAYPE